MSTCPATEPIDVRRWESKRRFVFPVFRSSPRRGACGDLLRQRAQPGDRERAKREYQTFLETQPPYLKDIEDVRAILKGLY